MIGLTHDRSGNADSTKLRNIELRTQPNSLILQLNLNDTPKNLNYPNEPKMNQIK